MSTYKRRIVYFSDTEWEQLGQVAKNRQTTISATVRDMLVEPVRGETIGWDAVRRMDATDETKLPGGGIQARQAQRDDLLRKINRK